MDLFQILVDPIELTAEAMISYDLNLSHFYRIKLYNQISRGQ